MKISPVGCPGFNGDEALGVAHALQSVDCRVGLAVSSSYGRLFGADGAFGTVLTVLLTLYVAFLAIGLMTGRTSLTLSGMAPKGLAIGLVLTFATSWPAYHAVIYGLLVGGPEQIATALAGGNGSSTGFALRLDELLTRFADVTKSLGDSAPGGPTASRALGPLDGSPIAAALVWISGILILLGSAGALVLTRIVLALLLAIGPVFIVLALFRQTRGLFEGWLRTSLLFALAPTLTVLAGSAAVSVLGPLIDAIADNPAAAIEDLRPVLELFMGSVVYFGLICMLMWTSASLVRGWRFGRSERDGNSPFAASAAPSLGPQAFAAASAGGGAPSQASFDHRVGEVISSLTRDSGRSDASTPSIRVEQTTSIARSELVAAASPEGGDRRRAEGLGQGIRPAASTARLSGAVR